MLFWNYSDFLENLFSFGLIFIDYIYIKNQNIFKYLHSRILFDYLVRTLPQINIKLSDNSNIVLNIQKFYISNLFYL